MNAESVFDVPVTLFPGVGLMFIGMTCNVSYFLNAQQCMFQIIYR